MILVGALRAAGSGRALWAAILLTALALRLAGVTYGLPFVYHQDEPILVNHALALGAGGPNPRFFVIPSFTIYLLFVVYAAIYLAGLVTGRYAVPEDLGLEYLKDPTLFYVSGRLVLGVLCGVLTVWALGRLVARGRTDRTAVPELSALLLAVLPLHVQHSHYLYADAPLTLAMTLLLWRCRRILDRPDLVAYLWAGAVLGWGGSVKYTMIYALPALVAVHVAAHGRRCLAPRPLVQAGLCGLSALAVFTVFAPYTWLDRGGFMSSVREQAGAQTYVGIGHHLLYSLAEGCGWPVLAMAAYGGVRLWSRDRAWAGALTVFIVTYYAGNTWLGQPFARYMLPLTPVAALLAAEGWQGCREALRTPLARSLVLGLIVTATALPSVAFVRLLRQPDTRTECARWLSDHVPADSVIALDSRYYGPHLKQNRGQIEQKFAYLDGQSGGPDAPRRKRLELALKAVEGERAYAVYTLIPGGEGALMRFLFQKPAVSPDLAEIEREGIEYIVINHSEVLAPVHDWVRTHADRLERVAVFSPYKDGSRRTPIDPHASTAAPHLIADILSRRLQGPYLEVFRVKAVRS